MKKRLLIMSVVLVCTVMKAQAASFDCVKSNTDIEKMICADAELSKLDEQLSSAYKYAFKITTDKKNLKKDQNKWLKKDRNACKIQACLKTIYQSRIEVLKKLRLEEFNEEVVRSSEKLKKHSVETREDPSAEMKGEIAYYGRHGDYPPILATYRLAMSKNDKLCHHVAQSLPQIKYNGVCEYCLDGVDLFKGIKWIKTIDMKTQQLGERYHTIIDINNDGRLDSASYMESMRQSHFYFYLWVNLDRPSDKGIEELEISDYLQSGDHLGVSSWSYPLVMNEMPDFGTEDYKRGNNYHGKDNDYYKMDIKNMLPFIFDGTTYVLMDTENDVRKMTKYKRWIVINKYIGGEYNGEYKPDVFADQCYFEVIFDKASKPYLDLIAPKGEKQVGWAKRSVPTFKQQY